MAHADIYATRWLTQTLAHTLVASKKSLQRLLREHGIDRRVSVRAQVETGHDSHGQTEFGPADLMANWADLDFLEVRFLYALDGETIGAADISFERAREDALYPGDCDPRWFDDPASYGVTQEQIALLREVPCGWCCYCEEEASPFILAGFGVTVATLAADSHGIVEISPDHPNSSDWLYADGTEIGTLWVSEQIDAAPAGDLDPVARAKRLKREEAERKAQLASHGADVIAEIMARANDPSSSMHPSIRQWLLTSHFIYEWSMARFRERPAIHASVSRGITGGLEHPGHSSQDEESCGVVDRTTGLGAAPDGTVERHDGGDDVVDFLG